MSNWDETRTATARRPRTCRTRARSATSSGSAAAPVTLRGRVPRARVPAFPRRARGRTHAEPGRRLQPRDQVRRLLRTRAAARRRPVRDRPLRAHRADGRAAARRRSRARTRPTSCTPCPARCSRARCSRSATCPRTRCAASRASTRCRCTTSATAPASASSASGRSRSSSAQYLPAQPGPIETPEGRRLGTHRGLMYYTLGQRQGLEVGGVRGAAEKPWYVAAKDLGAQHPGRRAAARPPAAAQRRVRHRAGPLGGGHAARRRTSRCAVKTRYRQADQACEVQVLPDGRCRVRTDVAQRAVTPGPVRRVLPTARSASAARVIAGAVREPADCRSNPRDGLSGL